jgi:hypothetical protein
LDNDGAKEKRIGEVLSVSQVKVQDRANAKTDPKEGKKSAN